MKKVTYHFVFDEDGKLIVRKYKPDLGKPPVKIKSHTLTNRESYDLKVMFSSILERGAGW